MGRDGLIGTSLIFLMAIDPPYRLDPFRNLVNVHWAKEEEEERPPPDTPSDIYIALGGGGGIDPGSKLDYPLPCSGGEPVLPNISGNYAAYTSIEFNWSEPISPWTYHHEDHFNPLSPGQFVAPFINAFQHTDFNLTCTVKAWPLGAVGWSGGWINTPGWQFTPSYSAVQTETSSSLPSSWEDSGRWMHDGSMKTWTATYSHVETVYGESIPDYWAYIRAQYRCSNIVWT